MKNGRRGFLCIFYPATVFLCPDVDGIWRDDDRAEIESGRAGGVAGG